MFGRRGGLAWVLALLAATSALARSVDLAVDGDLANDVIGDLKQDVVLSSRALSPSWWSIARCAVSAQPLDCVETRSQVAVDGLLSQISEARAAADDAALEPEVVDKVAELSETVVEAASVMLERKLGLGQQDDSDSKGLVEEGRGKKKKKIHKLIALVKLVLLVLVVKLKLAFVMMALQTLFQFKLVVMVFLILLIKKASLFAQLKQHANKGSDAQKVIYYEHAQHQHHYDEHGGGWGGGHDHHDEHAEASPSSGGGGWGGIWGRSYETVPTTTVQGQAGKGQVATQGVQNGVYRAADGSRIVVRQPDSHDMAFSAQRP